ncbi:hypothetical protein H4R33_000117 [Dimargaris cristalligena]|uniref:G-protein coupled receptors family 2 profile 2 domain-containing protein n=1 Tax=Dimargaris cristalligena TaxID=215637 RepID=A0A4V1J5U5_9FUNG|nr:hypothetical protein H4R33_000117 [Dimargaris cristalligena]RKP40279.1 hypothetical protein BJ085DRAFT_32323 [Dimargaris cristalligena]|eukprot:RKP40279.1 hypothetical protein BJ085DRAFT_32323 [Dimargaris cristalligena]
MDAAWDPMSLSDYVLLGVASGVFAINSIIYICIFFNDKKFLPFRTKNTAMMGFGLVASILWWYGSFFNQGGMLSVQSLNMCRFMGYWLRWALGGFALLAILLYRTLIYYQIFIRKRPARNGWIYLTPLLVYLPGLVIVILPTAMTSLLTAQRVGDVSYCVSQTPVVVVTWAYCTLVLVTLGFLSSRIRHVKATFNEFREMLWTIGPIIVALLVSGGLSSSDYQHTFWARLICNIFNLIAACAFFWAVYGGCFIGFLFNRQKYLARFAHSLAKDGFQSMGSERTSSITESGPYIEKPSYYISASQLPPPNFHILANMPVLTKFADSDVRIPSISDPVNGRHLIA